MAGKLEVWKSNLHNGNEIKIFALGLIYVS